MHSLRVFVVGSLLVRVGFSAVLRSEQSAHDVPHELHKPSIPTVTSPITTIKPLFQEEQHPGEKEEPHPEGEGTGEDLDELGAGQRDASSGPALLILGIIVCLVVLIFMLNAEDLDIKAASHTLVNHNMSITAALLITHLLRYIKLYFSPESVNSSSSHGHEPSSAAHLFMLDPSRLVDTGHHGESSVFSFVVLLLCVVFFQIVLQFSQTNPHRIEAVTVVGAHLTGFLGADALAAPMSLDVFSHNLYHLILYCLLMLLLVGVVLGVLSKVREFVNAYDGVVDRSEKRWEKKCGEYEDEAAAFAGGLVISLTIQSFIRGEVYSHHGVQKNPVLSQHKQLFDSAMAMLFFAVCLDLAARRFWQRAVQLYSGILYMSVGWSLSTWLQWTFWYYFEDWDLFSKGSVSVAYMSQFILSFLASTSLILVVDKIRDTSGLYRLTNRLERICTLCLGLTFEGVMVTCILEAVAADCHGNKESELLANIQVNVLVLAFVLPCWYVHILPQATHAQKLAKAAIKGAGGGEGSSDSGSEAESRGRSKEHAASGPVVGAVVEVEKESASASSDPVVETDPASASSAPVADAVVEAEK